MSSSKMNISNAYDEYQYFLVNYLLPLIGISYNNNLERVSTNQMATPNGFIPFIRQDENNHKVYFSSYHEDLFFLKWNSLLAKDSIGLARNVIRAFLDVSKFRITGNSRSPKMEYKTDAIREENYKLAVQKGICDWCAGTDNEAFYRLIQIMEQWSVQTYEGNKVTFGFVYDPTAKSLFSDDKYGTWLDFLIDDYAATLTDCIHSLIRLDKNCNFAGFLSITENNKVEAYDLSPLLPYRFARTIEKYVVGSCVGIFLLNNGDILISKHGTVCFIKRNLKWLNLSYDTFCQMVFSKPKTKGIPESLIKQIYASVLDVSFTHSGGIIAVISGVSKLLTSSPVLNICDNLLDERSLSEIAAKMHEMPTYKNLSPTEQQKRLLKRKVLLNLVAGRKFSDLDRKLRTELISMDGACIIDYSGNVCAIGAIIRNDSGSSGGGRSAAAKKLSKFDGFAVKISTDGYIELFINYYPVYAIK